MRLGAAILLTSQQTRLLYLMTPKTANTSGTRACLRMIRKKICSVRRSAEDLQRQAQRLKSSGCEEVITDIGSGLNCNKPGLKSLLNRILQGKVHTLSVVYEDRLLRFGTSLIRLLCRKTQTTVRVLENKPAQTFEEELAKDVITLMTVFCARLYGKRSHQSKRAAT